MDINKEREAFEKWFATRYPNIQKTIDLHNDHESIVFRNNQAEAWQAAKAQAVPEGYILIPKKMPDEVNDHLWDFMTDNFVCTNDYGDSFMACDDFNLDKFYAELVKAQEPAND